MKEKEDEKEYIGWGGLPHCFRQAFSPPLIGGGSGKNRGHFRKVGDPASNESYAG